MTIRVTAEYFVQDKYYCILTGIHKYKNCKRKIRWRRFIVLCNYDKSVNGQADRYKNIESRNNKKSPFLPSKTQQCLSLQLKSMWDFFQHRISQELERFIAGNHLCHFLYIIVTTTMFGIELFPNVQIRPFSSYCWMRKLLKGFMPNIKSIRIRIYPVSETFYIVNRMSLPVSSTDFFN